MTMAQQSMTLQWHDFPVPSQESAGTNCILRQATYSTAQELEAPNAEGEADK